MYKNQVPIIILTNKHTYPIHRAWGIKIVENARKWDYYYCPKPLWNCFKNAIIIYIHGNKNWLRPLKSININCKCVFIYVSSLVSFIIFPLDVRRDEKPRVVWRTFLQPWVKVTSSNHQRQWWCHHATWGKLDIYILISINISLS